MAVRRNGKRLTQFTDSARNYTATVTADANGNITRVQEAWTGAPNNWRTDFTFDYENRLTQVQGMTVVGGTVVAWNTVNHSYDGLGRRLKTTAGGTNYGHIYDGMKLAGNRNLGTSTDGTAWVNAVNDAKPLAALRISTAGATRYYGVSDERDPVRRTYTDGGTAGDTSQQSHYGEYELINGAAPVFSFYGPRGTKQSEVFPVRSLTFTENDVALPAEKGNLEYAGLALVYEGNRVKSALLGRDLNPLGRGDTSFYPVGALSLENATPKGTQYVWTGNGNSVNNDQQGGIGSSPNGNFDAAGMLKCWQSLHPDRICPLCPVIELHPCEGTTPDEICECIRQAACGAYHCWYNNPYCCENVYHVCSCLCGRPLDCLQGGCGSGSGGNGGSGTGGGGGGCGGGCGGGANGGAPQHTPGPNNGPQGAPSPPPPPGGTGNGSPPASKEDCEKAWKEAVDGLCSCIANMTDDEKLDFLSDGKYGIPIETCCNLRGGNFSYYFYTDPNKWPCVDEKIVIAENKGFWSNFFHGFGCNFHVCCPQFMTAATLAHHTVLDNDPTCIKRTIAAVKFYQCCGETTHLPQSDDELDRDIHKLLTDHHCCCPKLQPPPQN